MACGRFGRHGVVDNEQKQGVTVRGKAGRPRWQPPDFVEVERIAKTGVGFQHIADCLGISLATLNRRRKDFEKFEQAIRRGRARGIVRTAEIIDAGIENGDMHAAVQRMRCVGGWREKQEVEITGLNGGPIEVKTSITADKEIAKLLEQYADIARAAAESSADSGNVSGDADGEESGTVEGNGAGEPVDP